MQLYNAQLKLFTTNRITAYKMLEDLLQIVYHISFVFYFSELLCHVWASAKSCSCWFNEQFSTKFISTWNVSTTPTSTTDKVSQKELQQIDLVVPAWIFLRFWFRINRKFRWNSAKVFRIWIGCNVWERRWRHGRLSVVEKNMFNVFIRKRRK